MTDFQPFRRRFVNDLRSWKALILTLPWIFGIVSMTPEIQRRTVAESHQQITQGRVITYTPSDHNRCHYTFMAGAHSYEGADSAPTETVQIGQLVTVFFDATNPTYNALEDFSARNERDKSFQHMLIFGVFLIPIIILIAKSITRNRPNT